MGLSPSTELSAHQRRTHTVPPIWVQAGTGVGHGNAPADPADLRCAFAALKHLWRSDLQHRSGSRRLWGRATRFPSTLTLNMDTMAAVAPRQSCSRHRSAAGSASWWPRSTSTPLAGSADLAGRAGHPALSTHAPDQGDRTVQRSRQHRQGEWLTAPQDDERGGPYVPGKAPAARGLAAVSRGRMPRPL